MNVRLSSDVRKTQILEAATRLAEQSHFQNISSPKVAKESGCGHTLIFHHFQSMEDLKDAVVELAIKTNNLRLIGQAIVARHKAVENLDKKVKEQAIDALT